MSYLGANLWKTLLCLKLYEGARGRRKQNKTGGVENRKGREEEKIGGDRRRRKQEGTGGEETRRDRRRRKQERQEEKKRESQGKEKTATKQEVEKQDGDRRSRK